MLKYILAALAAFVLLTATLIPDDAYARRGGGGGFRPDSAARRHLDRASRPLHRPLPVSRSKLL